MGDRIFTHSLMGAPQKMTHGTGFRRGRCGWKPHLRYGGRQRFPFRPMGAKSQCWVSRNFGTFNPTYDSLYKSIGLELLTFAPYRAKRTQSLTYSVHPGNAINLPALSNRVSFVGTDIAPTLGNVSAFIKHGIGHNCEIGKIIWTFGLPIDVGKCLT